MALVRWFSLLLIVLALMLIGADIVSSLEMPGVVMVRSFDKILMLFGTDLKPWVQTSIPPALVSPGLSVLAAPGWAVIGVLGVVFSLLGQMGRGGAHKEASQPEPIHHH
jgi:hypothetical protein